MRMPRAYFLTPPFLSINCVRMQAWTTFDQGAPESNMYRQVLGWVNHDQAQGKDPSAGLDIHKVEQLHAPVRITDNQLQCVLSTRVHFKRQLFQSRQNLANKVQSVHNAGSPCGNRARVTLLKLALADAARSACCKRLISLGEHADHPAAAASCSHQSCSTRPQWSAWRAEAGTQ